MKDLLSGFEPGNKKYFRLLSAIILLVAAILRLTELGFSYSNDELSALARVRFDTFSDLVDHGFYVDGHPGGIQVFLYYWVKLFGMGEWAVRLPFALGGVFAVYFIIRLFTRWFGEITGLLTGAYVAFLEFPLLYSQIARPYGAGLLFSMMMTWYWTRLLFDEKPRKLYAAAFSLSAAACMYTHYFSFLLALIIGITGLFFLKRDRILYYILAGTGAALMFAPHIYITLNHLSIGGVGLWLTKPGNGWLWGHLSYLFNDSVALLLLTAVIMIFSLWFGRKALKLNKFHLFSLLFFILPFLTGFFYSRVVNPVLQHSVLIFSFPFLVALLFSFAGNFPARFSGALVLLVLLLGTAQTIIGKRYYSKQHFGEFRGIALAIDKWNSQYGDSNITRAISINNPWYLDFYLDQTEGGRTTFGQYDNRGGLQLDSLAMLLDSCKTSYFIYAWTKPVPDETDDIVRARFPCICEKADFGGLATATLYSRGNTCIMPKADTLFKAVFGPENQAVAGICTMDSHEYSKGFDGRLSEIIKDQSGNLTASVEAFSDSVIEGAVLVVSFHDESGETIHWLGAPARLFVSRGKWCNVRLTVTLPETITPDSRLKMFFWNPKQERLKIRNLSFTSEEYGDKLNKKHIK
ncbi:MAG: glycosyltransferase family 39 protein [Bacteroidales bacterium]|nr:glycosyltransferase family 39 protein [Bacteroidales bacterium]